MGRLMVVGILLVFGFFGGLSFGSKNIGGSELASTSNIDSYLQSEDIIVGLDILPEPTDGVVAEEGNDKINKTANFFEELVGGFYDFVVSTLYSFANLFFD